MIEFNWDPTKAKSNLRKHGVSFEEARSVFYDERALQFYDQATLGEDRFLLLGLSNHARVLTVVHCERGEKAEELRIISARKATKSERRYYEGETR
ncbi:MAG: BrnT family toxin [Pseudomonadota bacterium]